MTANGWRRRESRASWGILGGEVKEDLYEGLTFAQKPE